MISVQSNSAAVSQWSCPECGFGNETHVKFCGKCGHVLTKPCGKCLEPFRWDLECCPECGFRYARDERILFQDGWGDPSDTLNQTIITTIRIISGAKLAPGSFNRFLAGSEYSYQEVYFSDIRKLKLKWLSRMFEIRECKVFRRKGDAVCFQAGSRQKTEQLYALLQELSGLK